MSRALRTPAVSTSAWVIAVLLWCAAAGYVAGRIWMSLWDPPAGQVLNHTWYPTPWDEGSRAVFGASGTFVLVAFPLGLITGLGAALGARGRELATLAAVVLGTCLAAWVMCRYGVHVAPPDPTAAAKAATDGTALLGGLELPRWSTVAVLPAGGVLTVGSIYLLVGRPNQ